jgi:c-di-GMP-binding flagellar brake protein YcgR
MEERRRFVRLDTRLPVTYRVLPSDETKQSVTKDIGGGGVCVFVRDPLTPGTQLRIEIAVPDQERPIAFTGEVAWCEPYEIIGKTQRERSVEAGVRFAQIDPKDQQAIMRYVILSLQPHRPT